MQEEGTQFKGLQNAERNVISIVKNKYVEMCLRADQKESCLALDKIELIDFVDICVSIFNNKMNFESVRKLFRL